MLGQKGEKEEATKWSKKERQRSHSRDGKRRLAHAGLGGGSRGHAWAEGGGRVRQRRNQEGKEGMAQESQSGQEEEVRSCWVRRGI